MTAKLKPMMAEKRSPQRRPLASESDFHHHDADDRGEDRKRALWREALAEPKPGEHRGDKGRRGLEDENVRDGGLLERDDEAHHRRAEGHGNAERRKAKPAEGAERVSPIAQRDVDEKEERREQRTPKERGEGIGRRRARDQPGGAPGGRRAGDEKRAAAISCRRLRSRFGKGIDELRHFGQPGSLSGLCSRGAVAPSHCHIARTKLAEIGGG